MSVFEGWGVISAKDPKFAVWQKGMNFAQELKNIFSDQDQLFGGVAILSPAVANYLKQEGYDSVDKLTDWLYNGPDDAKPLFFRYIRSVSVDRWR